MAYFSLNAPVIIQRYPFDYHSHFGGILPVEKRSAKSVGYKLSYTLAGQSAVTVEVAKDRQLSLVGLVGGDGKYASEAGVVALFDRALQMMIEGNPLNALAAKANKAQYERGECAAENIYIACVVLAQRWALSDWIVEASATSPELYEEIRTQLPTRIRPDPSGPYNPALIAILRYFNNKIYSASKYTPFDDCYKTRSSLMKALLRDPLTRDLYPQWMVSTYAYLRQEGIRGIQAAIGADEIELADAIAQSFNALDGSDPSFYRLLVHTSAGYMPDKALMKELMEKVLPVLVAPGPSTIVGVDLLGTETKVYDYPAFFSFLYDNRTALATRFGSGPDARAAQMVCHIHCGEGASSNTDNRSMIGYYYANAVEPPDAGFYRAYSAYIARCLATCQGRREEDPRGPWGAGRRKGSGVAGLFDELFRNDSLTYGGCRMRRFDINSQQSIATVAYNGKRSMMAMNESLSQFTDLKEPQTWYQQLTALNQYSFRLGHAFYYRNYMAARFPLLAFDTNLGSNAITGASGLFDSVEGYRINRGFRHLDGYIDTDVLQQAGDAVAYLGTDALAEAQVEQFIAIANSQPTLPQVLANDDNTGWIQGQLLTAMAPVCTPSNIGNYYKQYCALVELIAGQSTVKALWFDALARTFAVFQNWRNYLLGADGQGVEHTDVQDEFLRMVILVAYQLLPSGQSVVVNTYLTTVQQLIVAVATDYWCATISSAKPAPPNATPLYFFDGYKAPASVVTLSRPKPAKT
ncbi:hypothetical protein [Lysobacter silvisoli]|uniref:Uncharacterized protein n=1 Tax=Lysobacter silvisoli TaxID=2293254 RepID=A0A371JXC1_9GAMM|nr:hypothetical protein [Lysobacter silvisoli]RDZ26300.1 hypothetical protein DX914_18725 [Lysobacter silvisoli]